MRTVPAIILAAVVAAALLALTALTVLASRPDDARDEAPASASSRPALDPVDAGSLVTLDGSSRERLRVRVGDLVDPLRGGHFDYRFSRGRFVGVRLRVANAGAEPYRAVPGNHAELVLDDGRVLTSLSLDAESCPRRFSSKRVEIAPRSKERGCVAFEVPPRARVVAFRYGYAGTTGVWRLRD